MGAGGQPPSRREQRLTRTAIVAVVVVVAAAVPGAFGVLEVPYLLSLLSVPAVGVLWLLAVAVGIQQRRAALFLLGFTLLPVAGALALVASFALPDQVAPGELPLVVALYLVGPLAAIVTAGVLIAGPPERADG